VRCHHCGKIFAVRTTGKDGEFIRRCPHCHGSHKFTSAGRHGSGAVNYHVTKLAHAPDSR
jgi:phage FluMu protein Com